MVVCPVELIYWDFQAQPSRDLERIGPSQSPTVTQCQLSGAKCLVAVVGVRGQKSADGFCRFKRKQ